MNIIDEVKQEFDPKPGSIVFRMLSQWEQHLALEQAALEELEPVREQWQQHRALAGVRNPNGLSVEQQEQEAELARQLFPTLKRLQDAYTGARTKRLRIEEALPKTVENLRQMQTEITEWQQHAAACPAGQMTKILGIGMVNPHHELQQVQDEFYGYVGKPQHVPMGA